jgi:hypothetical protein
LYRHHAAVGQRRGGVYRLGKVGLRRHNRSSASAARVCASAGVTRPKLRKSDGKALAPAFAFGVRFGVMLPWYCGLATLVADASPQSKVGGNCTRRSRCSSRFAE